MKIKELNLKHFGKFSNQRIVLHEGINLISGENESGKTTIHQFIRAMLFGMERGRGRAAGKDAFRTYEPWDNPAYYAGELRFMCEDKTFHLNRGFSRNGRQVELYCEDDGEELSVAQGDLEMLLGNMSPSQFDNTVSIRQCFVQTDELLAAQLKNYAANDETSGFGELDLSAALKHLKEKEKGVALRQKEAIAEKEKRRMELENEGAYLKREIEKAQDEIWSLTGQMEEKTSEIQRIEKERRESRIPRKDATSGRQGIRPLEALGMVVLILASLLLFQHPWRGLALLLACAVDGLYLWSRLHGRKQRKKEVYDEENGEAPGREEDRHKELLVLLSRLEGRREHLVEERKEKQIRYENLQEALGELGQVGEDEAILLKQREALTLAQDTLQRLSKEMQRTIKDRLNRRMAEILREITDGSCENVWMDEEMQIHLVEKGKRISLFQVSRGTVEQVYFALRMAASECLSEEEFPVILDDTFAYYDNDRLKRTLRWLEESGKQVLLLTCHQREEQWMEALQIPFHKIELETITGSAKRHIPGL